MKFPGFPRGTQYTPVPSPLLGPLLKEINDLAELKCTLRIMWLIHQKKGQPRFVTSTELLSDRVLQGGLQGLSLSPQEAILQGLHRAVERGTLLCLPLHQDHQVTDIYLLNMEADRLAALKIKSVKVEVTQTVGIQDGVKDSPGSRPNIFSLYEENVGMLTPMLVEKLKDAEQSYPEPWIEEAFRIAIERNRRNWRYIEAILQRWTTEGKDNGESGRHPKKTDREKYRKEYLRRRGLLPNQ